MKLCQNCQSEIIEGNQFCTKCGTKVEITTPVQEVKTNICSNCKNPISEGNAFCTACGTKITIAESNNEAKLNAAQISAVLKRCEIQTKYYILTFLLSAVCPFLHLLPQVTFELSVNIFNIDYSESYSMFSFFAEFLSEAKSEDLGLFLFIYIFFQIFVVLFAIQLVFSFILISPWTTNKKISLSEIEKKSKRCRNSIIGLTIYSSVIYMFINTVLTDDNLTCSLTAWGYLYFIMSISSIVLIFIGMSRKNNNIR